MFDIVKSTAALHYNDDNVDTQLIDLLFVFCQLSSKVINRTVQYSSHFGFVFDTLFRFNSSYAYRYCYLCYVYGIHLWNDAFRLEMLLVYIFMILYAILFILTLFILYVVNA